MSAPVTTVCPTYDVAPGICSFGSMIAVQPVPVGNYNTHGMGDTSPTPSTVSMASHKALGWGLVVLAGVLGFVAGRCSK